MTEGVPLDDPRAAIANLYQLHARVARLSINDFGTGYSSLSQLKCFPIYMRKINTSVVCDLNEDMGSRAIIRMPKKLGMRITSESVETGRQLDLLREQG